MNIMAHKMDPWEQIQDDDWRTFVHTWYQKRIQGQVRSFDEDNDAHCIKMRMQSICSADEITRHGIYLRDNLPIDVCLA
jgi:hypothetical protein